MLNAEQLQPGVVKRAISVTSKRPVVPEDLEFGKDDMMAEVEHAQRVRAVVAVHLFLRKESQILLLRRCNTGYEDGNYSVPAGHVERNEGIRQAMHRETAEEIGIQMRDEDLVPIGVLYRKSDSERVDFFFGCSKWEGRVTNCEIKKCDELRWCHVDNLPQNMVPYVRNAIERFGQGEHWFGEFGWESLAEF
ncbi:MAG: NUDIX hydrolase [Sulfobacillus sp.]